MSGIPRSDLLSNAFSEVKAWKTATFILGAVSVIFAISLAIRSNQHDTVMISHEMASATGPIKIEGGKKLVSPDYMQYIALADLALLLNWKPDTVEKQYNRFQNRLTTELYARENVKLVKDAMDFAKSGTSQSFYPESKIKVNDKGNIAVDGLLIRWTGEKEILRYKATYYLTYKEARGSIFIDDVRLEGGNSGK